ncbi:MAG: hypothetical protein HOP19_04300 [Acidobacteria bacterium]|nr:hypothetical protein [Acidobacteriota bacterium]
MRDLQQYIDFVSRLIDLSPAINAELDLEQFDYRRGIIEGTLYFSDGSRLEFRERVVIVNARPVKRAYRYQYVREGKAVFRYDNAPHHPQLPGFPHHKHDGRKLLSSLEPKFEQVLQEVAGWLLPEPSEPASSRKSRSKAPKRRDHN